MAQRGQIFLCRSDPTVHFTGALAQNAGASENIVLPASIGSSPNARARVASVVLTSVENLAWELWLFGRSTFRTADTTTETFRGRWSFVAADGLQVAGVGLYAYYIDGNDIPYEDEDGTGRLHLMLVNRSAAAKTAGAGGRIMIALGLEPSLGW